MKRIAFITGITGQDGSYLSEFLLSKGYKIYGIIRRTSEFRTTRIDHLLDKIILKYGDVCDKSALSTYVNNIFNENPDLERFEIYHLAAQSHVKISFEIPEYTTSVDALGTLALLEIIKNLPDNRKEKTRFYQAGTSEMFGVSKESPQKETTPMIPRSPYAAAKLYAHNIVKIYREGYGIWAANGILFNHESPRRGETFVTRKITRGIARIDAGLDNCLYLGNLNAKRDWGHARDYCEAMWKILQQKKPEDFVIATGFQYSIKEFINITAKKLNLKINWKGKGFKEKGLDKNGKIIIECDKKYFRPLDVNTLLGDATKARRKLKWKPKENIHSLIEEMILFENQILDAN